MYMRFFICFLICLLSTLHSFANNSTAVDSLLKQLECSTKHIEKIRIYRNLSDIHCDTPQEKNYLLSMYQEAVNANNREYMLKALTDIILTEIDEGRMDSAYHYVEILHTKANKAEAEDLSAYFKMLFFDSWCAQGKTAEAINNELIFLENKDKNHHNPYQKIVDAFITGGALFANDHPKESIPYFLEVEKAVKLLPAQIAFKYYRIVTTSLAFAYSWSGQFDAAIEIMEKGLKSNELYYETYIKKERPYYNFDVSQLSTYSSLFIYCITDHLDKALYYWEKIYPLDKFLKGKKRYRYYLTMNNYYLNCLSKPDYKKALEMNDSLIKIGSIYSPNAVPELYSVHSQIYEAMGNHKVANEYLKKYYAGRDSLSSSEMRKQLSELQVKYDLNKLSNEKSLLEINNKRIIVFSLIIMLIVVITVCGLLYYNLRKEKTMKNRLRILHEKSEESEKMKTVFINSVCHEIRTPLNSIVGFSDLLFHPDIDEEMRQSFPSEIQKNTRSLTSLIDNMLEVSSIDVSDNLFPSESVSLNEICNHEMNMLKEYPNPNINYLLEIPEENEIISSNPKYLSLLIAQILNNANKFTEQGSITLGYKKDLHQKQIQVSITDTGCGIPKEKYEEVFERFVKLDSYSQGNGIGLYLCQIIAKRLPATIHFDPEYTNGTRVIITLPL